MTNGVRQVGTSRRAACSMVSSGSTLPPKPACCDELGQHWLRRHFYPMLHSGTNNHNHSNSTVIVATSSASSFQPQKELITSGDHHQLHNQKKSPSAGVLKSTLLHIDWLKPTVNILGLLKGLSGMKLIAMGALQLKGAKRISTIEHFGRLAPNQADAVRKPSSKKIWASGTSWRVWMRQQLRQV